MHRTHRIGSYTFGITLILFGGLMLLHIFLPDIRYDWILRCWPVTLIFLGIEILIANLRSTKMHFIYDIPAIIMIFVLIAFAFGMAFAEWFLEYSQMNYRII